MNWFQSLVFESAKRMDVDGRGGVTKLAKRLDLPRQTVDNWISQGNTPAADTIEQVVGALGGDILRCLPGYVPPVGKHLQRFKLHGQVAASPLDFPGDVQSDIDCPTDAWHNSSLNRFCIEEHFCLEVYGHSMAPDYANGEYIVCRHFAGDPKDLPDRTPCIFLEHRQSTFKLLRRIGALHFGQPINLEYPLVPLGPHASIQSIVLGKFSTTNQAKKQAKYSGLPLAAEPRAPYPRKTK